MIRLFVGIELPPPVQQRLDLLSGGIPGARWTAPGNYHLSLAFIGEVDEPVAADLDEQFSEIHEPGFDLTLSGVGQFDRGGHTRVIWAGIAANPALEHLQAKVRSVLTRRNILTDLRKFTPHITLARIAGNGSQERIFHYLADHNLFAMPPITIAHFTLFESLRGNGGPVYKPLQVYPLG